MIKLDRILEIKEQHRCGERALSIKRGEIPELVEFLATAPRISLAPAPDRSSKHGIHC